jgi:hypothetical protein
MAVAIAATAAIGITSAPTVSTLPNYTLDQFGKWERLHDPNGIDVTFWKVDDLRPGTETIPGDPLAGTLWESTATARSERGHVVPWVPNFNARVINVANYLVIWQTPTPNGVSMARLHQGAETTGKLYFDVTGPDPTIVVYSQRRNPGLDDLGA